MEIVVADKKDAERIASIISDGNKDVAELFGLTIENAPKHPSFCKPDWIISDFERGQDYFISVENGISTGCVAFEQPDNDTAYLNRLSILPKFRKRGRGAALVKHVIDYSKEKGVKIVSIGIIAEHRHLKEWYLKLGFIEGATQKFDHLPFNVLYMRYVL